MPSQPLSPFVFRPLAVLGLIVLCLFSYLPGDASIPPFDRDEARYVQATKQMLESGDYVDIRFQDEARHKKPIGIYWLQSAVVGLTTDGPAEWGEIERYRLVSILGAVAAILLTFWAGIPLVGDRAAALGAALLAPTIMMVAESHQAKTDTALLATTTLAFGLWARLALDRLTTRDDGELAATRLAPGWGTWLGLALAVGAGILIKGPPMVLFMGAAVLGLVLWQRDLGLIGALRPVKAGLIVVAVVAPWLIAIAFVSDGAFFEESLGHDFLPKLIAGQESHGAPPGYYLLLLPLFFWPATLVLAPGVIRAWMDRHLVPIRILITWIVPAWLIVEAIPTKLPHYVLPTYPAIALLCGWALMAAWRGGWQGLTLPIARIGAAVWLAAAMVLPIAAVVLPVLFSDGVIWWTVPAAVILIFAAWWVWGRWLEGRTRASLTGAVVVAVLSTGMALGGVLPNLTQFWPTRMIAEAVTRETGGLDVEVAIAGIAEPSLVFQIGRNVVFVDGAGAADALAAPGPSIAVVEDHNAEAFLDRAEALGIALERLGEPITGFNYARGQWRTFRLYVRG